MNNSAESCEDKTLDFYIQFTRLKAEDFGKLLLSTSDIYNGLRNLYFHETGLVIDDSPSLEVFRVQTGDSIKFCFTEGWLPNIYSDNNDDIIIGTPKKLGIPLLILYLLLCSAEKIIDVNNKHLDRQINEIELMLKQDEINKLKEKSDNKYFRDLQKKSDGLVYALVTNNTFTKITINNALIKDTPLNNNHVQQ